MLRALTTVRPGDETVTPRPALLNEVAGTPSRSALVDALIAARLLVSDGNADGHPLVRVAHEALLSRWPRARDIINANRNFLEMRPQRSLRRGASLGHKAQPRLPEPGLSLATPLSGKETYFFANYADKLLSDTCRAHAQKALNLPYEPPFGGWRISAAVNRVWWLRRSIGFLTDWAALFQILVTLSLVVLVTRGARPANRPAVVRIVDTRLALG